MAGVHGEFELLFTITPRVKKEFLDEATKIGWSPIPIGEVDEGDGVYIQSSDKAIPIDSGLIRNLSDKAGSNHRAYIGKLLEIAQEAGI